MISKLVDIKDTFNCDDKTAEEIREYVIKMYEKYYGKEV
jgi:hypothetical protein